VLDKPTLSKKGKSYQVPWQKAEQLKAGSEGRAVGQGPCRTREIDLNQTSSWSPDRRAKTRRGNSPIRLVKRPAETTEKQKQCPERAKGGSREKPGGGEISKEFYPEKVGPIIKVDTPGPNGNNAPGE